jgi:hypothetical protein
MPECKICLVEHEQETHKATLSIHSWLREEIRKKLEPPPAPPEIQPKGGERTKKDVRELPKSA